MKKLRLNTTYYVEKLKELQPRMDDHLERRGAWQLQMFGKYYDLFELEKPYMIAVKVVFSIYYHFYHVFFLLLLLIRDIILEGCS